MITADILNTEIKQEILKRTNGRCHLCGVLLDKNNISYHLFNPSSGGDSSWDYALPIHSTFQNLPEVDKPNVLREILDIGISINSSNNFSKKVKNLKEYKTFDKIQNPFSNVVGQHKGTEEGISEEKKKAVYNKTDGHCHICGENMTYRKMTVDHLVSRHHGGDDSLGNLLPAHGKCNRTKWTGRLDRWIQILNYGIFGFELIKSKHKLSLEIIELIKKREMRNRKKMENFRSQKAKRKN